MNDTIAYLNGFRPEAAPMRPASEFEAASAIEFLNEVIRAAEHSQQAGEDAVVAAARAIGWKPA